MEQIRKALSRAKTVFENIQDYHKSVYDELLNQSSISVRREIHEIELAQKELSKNIGEKTPRKPVTTRLKESTEMLRLIRDLTEKRFGLIDEVKAIDSQVAENQKTMVELGIDWKLTD